MTTQEPQKGTMEEQELRNKVVSLFATANEGESIVEREQGLLDAMLDIIIPLHHLLQKVREEALAREKQLKQVHMMELDAISCKSIEEFVLWRDHRKQRPKQAELNQDPVHDFFTAPEEVQRPVYERALQKAQEEQGKISNLAGTFDFPNADLTN